MKSRQLDLSQPIPGCYFMTGALAQQGYRLNKFCRTLIDPSNRAAFQADELGYIARFGLSETEAGMIAARDWLAMVKYGASPFLVLRLSGATGVGLSATGAQMRGESLEDFLATRLVKGAR